MDTEKAVREQIRRLLLGGNAHLSFDQAVAEFPQAYINTFPPQVPYTPWHLLEHLRITQWDILEFIRNPEYVSPAWPSGYWPSQDSRADEVAWQQTLASFQADLRALLALLDDPQTDLYSPLPHGDGQNILREFLLVADHNAYHIGEFAIQRQVMGTWGSASH
ncbi:MAG TPA: DinB family protein [Ktedonobacteraceae bacterium]